jgi:hypothetical protein
MASLMPARISSRQRRRAALDADANLARGLLQQELVMAGAVDARHRREVDIERTEPQHWRLGGMGCGSRPQ